MLKELEINRPENTNRGYHIFKLIRRGLKQKVKKVIYLSKEFDSSRRENLTSMAEAAGASVTETRDEATHQLYPGGQFKKPDNEHCTPLKKWDDRVLVHWWYSPPSYQTWVSHEQLPTTELFENARNEQNKWKLCAKWLEDSFLFNEWMLEWDFQLNSKSEHIGPHKHAIFKAFKPIEIGEKNRIGKRKKSPSPESRPKKKGKPKRSKDEDVDLTKGMENPDPKPNIELVEIPNIPLANQPSANIPPSTNRNLRNVQLTDLDINDEGKLNGNLIFHNLYNS